MIRKLLVSCLLVSAALSIAACGGTPAPSGDSTGAAPAAPSGAVSSGGAGTKPAEPAGGAKPAEPSGGGRPAEPSAGTSGDETRDIQDISGSLANLKSYRLRFNFAFDGKDDQGKPQKGSMEFVQEIIKDSQDQHIRWAASGDAANSGQPGAFELYQVGGTSYIYSADGQGGQKCIGMSGGQGGAGFGEAFKPSDIIGGLEKARLADKGETVNGVVVDHYVFDQSAISFGAFASAKGDAWLAQDGGFLVKYVGTATGKNSFLAGKSGDGTFTWEYNVQDANQVEAIALPTDCEGQKPGADIPMPKNATEQGGFGKLITFKSPDSPADVAAFYKQELPGQGWKAGDANELGDLQTLSFSKDSRKLAITITKEDQGGSSVLISEE